MNIFSDFGKFFETRLEEFLQNNPHLELQAILEQLREQEEDTKRLISQSQLEEQRLQAEILNVAQDIQVWHSRIEKAKSVGRMDLANAAAEREASLLRQGNKLWGQMEGAKKRILQAKELLQQIQQRKQEVSKKATEAEINKNKSSANSSWDMGWQEGINYANYTRVTDPLEAKFQNLEIEDELNVLKRNLKK